jgi:hypothetical protein
MQVADLRLLFRLPVPELDPNVGCNLTAAAMMLNLISGFSRWFFHTDEAALIAAQERQDGRQRSRQRFVGFVESYWPQIQPEAPAKEVAERLYTVRNSLAHDLGVGEPSGGDDVQDIRLAKRALLLDDIVYLERAVGHPLTRPVIEQRDSVYVVHLLGVYWALHQMLHAALEDRPAEIETALSLVDVPEIEEISPPQD